MTVTDMTVTLTRDALWRAGRAIALPDAITSGDI